MDDSEYKRHCARPDVMRRTEIRATGSFVRRADPELAARLDALLSTPALPKPSGHQGGEESDFLFLDLAPEDVEAVVDALGDLEASLGEAGEPAPLISQVGGLLDRWHRADSSRPAV